MDYELGPQRTRPGGPPPPWIVAGALALLVAVVGAAVLGAAPATREELTAVSSDEAGPPAVALPQPTSRGAWRLPPPDATLAPPAGVDCTTLSAIRCRTAVRAARGVVWPLGSRPTEAVVHASLVCGSHRDCPRSFLRSATPVGSVVFRFDDGRETWVNVVVAGTAAVGRPRELRAIVVRSIFPSG